jgi:hypothetical protein
LKELLLSRADDASFLSHELALFFELTRSGLHVSRVDAGFHGGRDQILVRERFHRLRFQRSPQDLFDLVSRILFHG